MWLPVVLTSVTTACGFLGFLTTATMPLRHFGLFTAFGVIGAMVFSLIITPVAIVLFGNNRGKVRERPSFTALLSKVGLRSKDWFEA